MNGTLGPILLFGAIAAVVAIVGVALGMLLARPIGHLADRGADPLAVEPPGTSDAPGASAFPDDPIGIDVRATPEETGDQRAS